jgi:hypothetical protein
MHVLARHRPTWADVQVDHEQVAVGLRRWDPHHRALAGYRVLVELTDVGR